MSGGERLDPIEVRFWRRVQKTAGCWLWTGVKNTKGYGMIKDGGRVRSVARVAWEIANYEPFPRSMQACHHCDNPSCVNPAHIFLGTHVDNMADMVAKGRQAAGDRNGLRVHPAAALSGERNGRAKLTRAQVEDIRQRLQGGAASQSALAREYGVTPKAVNKIALGLSWREQS